jgi:hypothetical protein
MAESEEHVRIPKAMYEKLEARSKRLSEIERTMWVAGKILENYNISTVLTLPPSGHDAAKINQAVRDLVKIAKEG